MNSWPVGYQSIADLFRYNYGLMRDYMEFRGRVLGCVRHSGGH